MAAGFLASLLGLPPTVAEAQNVITLVSNTGQTANGGGRGPRRNQLFAQPFTTGSHAAGYSLHSVVVDVASLTNFDTNTPVTATLRADSSADPGTTLATLTSPSSFVVGLNTFTAPANTNLVANTTYHFVLAHERSYSSTAHGLGWNRVLLESGIDSGAAAGWDIDTTYRASTVSGWNENSPNRAMMIQVMGSRLDSDPTGAPAVSGVLRVGQTVEATLGTLADANGLPELAAENYTIQWLRYEVAVEAAVGIMGETGTTYTLAEADVGFRIGFQMTYHDDDNYRHTVVSGPSDGTVVAAPPTEVTVTANNDSVVGGPPGGPAVFTLTRTGDTAAPLVVDFSLGNRFDGGYANYNTSPTTATIRMGDTTVEVSIATGSQQAGDMPSITLTVEDPGDGRYAVGDPATASVTVTPRLNSPATGKPEITGTAAVGQTLMAGRGTIADPDDPLNLNVEFSYQWQRVDADGVSNPIDVGTDSATYRLVAADEGKRIRVTLSFDDELDNDEMRTSDAYPDSGTVAPAPPEVTVMANAMSVVGGNDAVFTLTRSVSSAAALPVSFMIAGTHSVTSPPTSPVEIPANMTTVDVPVPTTAITGMDQTVVLTVADPSDGSYTVPTGTGSTATVTVTAPPAALPEVTVTARELQVIGGNSGPAIFVLARTGPTTAALDVEFTMGGEQPAYRTYGNRPRMFTIPAGLAMVEVSVPTSAQADGDSYDMTLTLDAVAGRYTVGTSASATVSVREFLNVGPATGMLVIEGTLEVGRTLTIDTTDIDDPDGVVNAEYTYSWRRADDASGTDDMIIVGALSSTYVLVAADLGKHIRAQVAFQDDNGNGENLETGWTAAVAAAAAPAEPTKPAISVSASPTTVVGDGMNTVTFTFSWEGTVDFDGDPLSYQIDDPDNGLNTSSLGFVAVANNENVIQDQVSGTGPATRTLTTVELPAGAGSRTVRVTVIAETFSPYVAHATMGSATVTVTAPTPTPTPTPAVPEITVRAEAASVVGDGTNEVAFILTWTGNIRAREAFLYSLLDPDDGIDGGAVERAMSSSEVVIDPVGGPYEFRFPTRTLPTGSGNRVVTFTLRSSPGTYTVAGGSVTLTVTVTAPGTAPAPTNRLPDGMPSITGMLRVGQAVTAVTTGISDPDGPATLSFSYRWRRADDAAGAGAADIGGATSASYTLDAADAGKHLRVVVSYTDAGNTQESVESDWTATPVVPADDRPAIGAPLITGTAEVGRTLTADTTGITDPDGELGFGYTWARSTDTPNLWENVGAQGQQSTYQVAPADLDRRLRVQVVATDSLGGTTRLTSGATSAVVAAGTNPPEPGPPPDPVAQAARILETTEQSLALLAPNVAAGTVQVLSTRFDSIASGAPGGGLGAATLGGGRPLGALSGALATTDGAGRPPGAGAAPAAQFAREVAALFGLHLPAAGAAGAAAARADAGALSTDGAGRPATGRAASTPLAYASVTQAANTPGAPGALEAQGAAAHSFAAQGTATRSSRGRGAGEADDTGDWQGIDTDGLHSPGLRPLLAQSSFSVGLGAAHGAHGGAKGASHWTLWGRGAASGFESTEKDSARDVDGESVSAYLGADVQSGNMALGLAVGWSESELDYAGGVGGGSGELETELTGLHPYLHWTRSPNTSLYAMLGYGFGEATLDDAGLDASLTSDLDMRMLAVGLHHALPGGSAGRHYGVKLDAFWVDLESDGATRGNDTWQPVDTQSGRVRLALTGATPLQQGGGANGLLAEGELAARLDAGDAPTAKLGAEFGAGLRWTQGGFSLAARGRVLLVLGKGDYEDYDEWGASLAASYQPGAGGRGLRFSLSPAWGEVGSGVDALYESAGALRELGDDARSSRGGVLPDRLDFELGYGLAALGGRAEFLPFARLSAAGESTETRLRVGTRFDLPHRAGDALPVHRLGLEVFGETRAGVARDRRVGLELNLGF